MIGFIGLGETSAFTNAIAIGWVVELATGEAAVSTQLDLQQKAGAFRFPESAQIGSKNSSPTFAFKAME